MKAGKNQKKGTSEEECRLNDVKVEFEILKSGFMVVFHRDLTMSENETVPGDGGINGGINQLFLHIRNNPGKRTVDIAKSLNISLRTTERWIRKLREEGKIKFKGSKKAGGYHSAEAGSGPVTE